MVEDTIPFVINIPESKVNRLIQKCQELNITPTKFLEDSIFPQIAHPTPREIDAYKIREIDLIHGACSEAG